MVGDSFTHPFKTVIPRERRVLFLMEPPNVRRYEQEYLMQFQTVITPQAFHLRGVDFHVENPCLGWIVGTGLGARGGSASQFESLDSVKAFAAPEKTRNLSMITSLLAISREHRKRLDFFYKLYNEMGRSIDLFGRDFEPISDKMEGLASYKYTIAVENCSVPNYWTEKLADAWLAWSLPLYYGDPTILDQIPDARGLIWIDINDFPRALATIKEVLNTDPYTSRLDAIARCREWVIQKANPFNRMAQLMNNSPEKLSILSLDEPVTLVPAKKVHRPVEEMSVFLDRLLGPQRFEILYYRWRRKQFLKKRKI